MIIPIKAGYFIKFVYYTYWAGLLMLSENLQRQHHLQRAGLRSCWVISLICYALNHKRFSNVKISQKTQIRDKLKEYQKIL